MYCEHPVIYTAFNLVKSESQEGQLLFSPVGHTSDTEKFSILSEVISRSSELHSWTPGLLVFPFRALGTHSEPFLLAQELHWVRAEGWRGSGQGKHWGLWAGEGQVTRVDSQDCLVLSAGWSSELK